MYPMGRCRPVHGVLTLSPVVSRSKNPLCECGRERGGDLVCLARALGGCVACSVCAMRGYGVESAWESVNGAIGQCV